jgi:response regulator RpfG family c-di-GMP phosphodiesterase
MVVDDEPDNVATIEQELKHHGFNVISFTNPFQALEQQGGEGNNFVDLVIADVRMAKMSGFQLAKMRKKLRMNIRVILVTAFEVNKDEFGKVLPSTQIHGFLTKPFYVNELVEAIKNFD